MAIVHGAVPSPFLALPVGHVHGIRAKEEMVRVDATPLIAAMTDEHARRNGAVPDLPGQAVSELDNAVAGQLAVAVVVERRLPD
jgi:hypothetical protein